MVRWTFHACGMLLMALAVLAMTDGARAEDPRPVGDVKGQWALVKGFSDEFNAPTVDTAKWDNDPNDWGVWSWEPHNAYTKAGALHVRMEHAPHTRGKQKLFYKSGILKSRESVQYGYFEARIKGCSRFPGACPAFWVIGNAKVDGKRVGAEIDFMEIQEVRGNVQQVDCNLHGAYFKNGKKVAIHERRHWIAPWDPRDDYHVYACLWREDTIIWYVDGHSVAEARNWHWHIPLQIHLSMGLRTPLRLHKGAHGEGKVTLPNPEASTGEGFPTEMLVDYVRVWRRAN